jgi:transcriptional regulator GlxA family with amidase domain
MENNIEEPLTTDDIAYHVKISRRQLERLFKKHLNAVPSRYYLQIRLECARSRLFSCSESIADIGLSCGFSSGAHFSTAYRNQYGLTPSEDRSLNQKMQIEK